MKNIKVLGSGCSRCKATIDAIQKRAAALNVEIELEKVEDFAQIAAYGVMSTPGVLVDGKVVHAGGLPTQEAIDGWLQAA